MKELMEFDYVEVDELLYPQSEGKEVLDSLGKYGRMRLKHLWKQELLLVIDNYIF